MNATKQNASGAGGVPVDRAGRPQAIYRNSASEAHHQSRDFEQPSGAMPFGFNAKPTPTMTSREIADLCEARHNDVVETIKRLLAKGVLRESRNTPRAHQPAGGGRPTMTYELTKRDCLVVVSGYNDELRAKIIDRWMELEAAAAPAFPDFANPVAAARAWADAVEARQALQLELVAAAPAVEFVDRYVDSSGTKGFRQACKLLGIKEPAFRAFLLEKKIMYRLADEWVPFAQHLDAGRFVVKTGTAEISGHAFNSARFTLKGLEWVAGELAKHQLEQRTSAACSPAKVDAN